jgi:hypothetical protein
MQYFVNGSLKAVLRVLSELSVIVIESRPSSQRCDQWLLIADFNRTLGHSNEFQMLSA